MLAPPLFWLLSKHIIFCSRLRKALWSSMELYETERILDSKRLSFVALHSSAPRPCECSAAVTPAKGAFQETNTECHCNGFSSLAFRIKDEVAAGTSGFTAAITCRCRLLCPDLLLDRMIRSALHASARQHMFTRVCVCACCHGYPGVGYRDCTEVNTSSPL